jgi:threonine dehydrogenase-like Zn-dependent dehydrogenase
LSRLGAGLYDMLCLPLKILGGDGAPARVLLRRREEPEARRAAAVPVAKMRAVVVVPKDRNVQLVEHPVPRAPRDREVLLRMVEVGICGTDREICAFEYGSPPPDSEHLILGHEALAEVLDVGPNVEWARPGQLVVPTVRRACTSTRCGACRAGRPDFCVTSEFRERGIMRAHGFLREYLVEEQRYLVPVPRVLEEVAVLVEPLSVAAKAGELFTAIHARLGFDPAQPRGLVLGAGPVGLLGAMVLRASGIESFVYSREPEDGERADLVHALGAGYVSSERTPLETLAERIGSVDVIFEAVGVPEVAFGALRTLAPNGIFILSGVPAHRAPVPAQLSRGMRDLVLKNQVIVGTVNAGRSAYEGAIRLIEQFTALFPDAVRSLPRRVPLDEAPAVLARGVGIKDVVTFRH